MNQATAPALHMDFNSYVVRRELCTLPRGAERSFVAANARFKRIGRQRFVAVLASRSELKHAVFPLTKLF